MDLGAAGLARTTLPDPWTAVSNGILRVPHRGTRGTSKSTCTQANGLSLIQGPSLSGKSTFIREVCRLVHRKNAAVAVVDGKGPEYNRPSAGNIGPVRLHARPEFYVNELLGLLACIHRIAAGRVA